MEKHKIARASEVPHDLQRAAKCALSVGAACMVSNDNAALMVQFTDNDNYYFDPDNATLHMLELLGHARSHGFVFVAPSGTPVRQPFVIRTVFSSQDVRVQIGQSKWFQSTNTSTGVALRHAVVDAFCAYYDESLNPEA